MDSLLIKFHFLKQNFDLLLEVLSKRPHNKLHFVIFFQVVHIFPE